MATLPTEPLSRWLRDKIATAGGPSEASVMLGLDQAQLRRMADGENRRVHLRTADALFTKAGEPHLLAMLYPLDVGDLADVWCDRCDETVTVGADRACPWCSRKYVPKPLPKPLKPRQALPVGPLSRQALDLLLDERLFRHPGDSPTRGWITVSRRAPVEALEARLLVKVRDWYDRRNAHVTLTARGAALRRSLQQETPDAPQGAPSGADALRSHPSERNA